MRLTPLALALVFASFVPGCSAGGEGGPGTFSCAASDAGVSASCAYDTQYCEIVTQGGSTTAMCRAVPSACAGAGSPCTCITAMLTGVMNRSCSSNNITGARQTQVAYSR